jgi:hypothetical protein
MVESAGIVGVAVLIVLLFIQKSYMYCCSFKKVTSQFGSMFLVLAVLVLLVVL